MAYRICEAVEGLRDLREESVQLVYMDPPYNTGRDFYNFDDRFSSSQDYREGLIMPVMKEIQRVLRGDAVVVVHVEPKISHHIRVVMDEVFGEKRFVNEVVWRSGGNHHTEKKMQRSHDTLIVYSKGGSFVFNAEYKPYDEKLVESCQSDGRGYYQTSALKNSQPEVIPRPNLRYEWKGVFEQWYVSRERMQRLDDEDRLVYGKSGVPRVKKYFHEMKGIPVKDVWDDVKQIQMWEKLPYATQKPVALLERIVRMFSNRGDLVVDPFGGSGTTGRACVSTGRNYQLFDINPEAINLFEENLGGQLDFG